MGWFKSRKEAKLREEEQRQASTVAAMATAFASALGGVLSAQTESIKQQSQFLNTLQDLSARKAAQVLGQKGGRAAAKSKKAAREGARREPECVLCRDPFHRGTTIEQIQFHRMHEGRDRQEPLSLTFAEAGANGNSGGNASDS